MHWTEAGGPHSHSQAPNTPICYLSQSVNHLQSLTLTPDPAINEFPAINCSAFCLSFFFFNLVLIIKEQNTDEQHWLLILEKKSTTLQLLCWWIPRLLLVGIYSQPIASETNYCNTILNINSLLLSEIGSNMVHSEDNFSSVFLKGRSQLFNGDNGKWVTNFRKWSFPMSLYQKSLSEISAGDLRNFFYMNVTKT